MPESRPKRVLQLRFPARAAELKAVRDAMKSMQDGLVGLGQFGPKWLSPAVRKRKKSTALL